MERVHSAFEMKALPSEDGCFSGYASVFGNIDSHGDIVARGAFADSLTEAKKSGIWPHMLVQHAMGSSVEDSLPVGVWTKMQEDHHGLYVEGKLKTQRGRDVYELMKMTPRPALNGMSIGYRATSYRIHGRHEEARRTLKAVKLFEVSLVSDPSNGLARVDAVKRVLANNHNLRDAIRAA